MRITDKMRLDWLDKNMGVSLEPSFVAGPWVHINESDNTRHNYDSLRLAIDAAILSSRRDRKRAKR